MARRKTKIFKSRKDTYAIVVDGKTEVWYFQMLKRNEPNLQVNIEPKIPQKKKLSEQYEKILELAEDFNDIYLKLKSNLSVALTNAQKTKRGNLNEIERGICEMNLFFETKQIKTIIN